MIFKSSYDSAEAVPQEFKDSFKEVEGKFVFTGQIETKDTIDYKELHEAKKSAFDKMHENDSLLKEKVQSEKELQNKLEVAELKLTNGADLESNESIQELVAKRVKAETADITKQLEEANEKNGEFQNKIFSGEKSEFVNGIVGSFSDTVKDDAKFMLNQIFERQADNTYLTKAGLGLDAGLNAEQATAKLLETRTHWQKQNQGDGAGGGGSAQPKEGRAKFDDLLKKQQGGEKLNRQESIELSTLANQLKNEE